MSAHTCNAACWAEMVRYGASPECDPWTARAAAEREAREDGAVSA